MLNQSKYCRFNTDATARDLNEFIPDTDLNDVRLLPNYRFAITYRDYKEVKFNWVQSIQKHAPKNVTNFVGSSTRVSMKTNKHKIPSFDS